MSFYENLKEIYKDTTHVIYGKDFAGKIQHLLKLLSFVVILLSYLIVECGFGTMISYDIDIKLPQSVYIFLTTNKSKFIITYFVYYIVVKPIIKKIVIEVKARFEKDLFPLWHTIEDIIEILFYIIILLIVLQDLLLCIKGNELVWENNILVYVFVVLSMLFGLINKIYIHNKNRWYYNCIKYTRFFDSDGKRIAEDDRLVYRNQIYKLHNVKGTWYLQGYSTSTDIKLEDAVVDKEEQIKVYFYSMGRRKEEDGV